jgi:acyl dehydratase
MPYDSSIVGTVLGPFEYEVDPGWTMAYAAGIDDTSPRYLDSLRSERLLAHPVFPVCFVWDVMREMDRRLKNSPLSSDEAIRRVHATQDMIVHRLIRPPEKLTMHAAIIGVERRRPGTYMLTRYDTVDAKGALVSTVYWGVIYRGVDVAGPNRPPTDSPAPPTPSKWDGHPRGEFGVPIAATLGHVYTACARQKNAMNIHTDTTAARRAGLPEPILMGTATLALSVSKIVAAEAAGDAERVARIYGRFGAMVLMPSEVTVKIMTREKVAGGESIFFETLNAEGGRAIRDGVVVLRP